MSLIEIMIAMTMLAIVLSSLAKLSMYVSMRGRINDLVAKRTAILQQQAARLGGMPFSSLATTGTGSTTVTMGKSTFTQTITITTASTTRKTIKIVVKPTSTTGTPYTIGADSLTFDRANPPGTPLCSGC